MAAAMTDADVRRIREEVGDEPSTGDLARLFSWPENGHWLPVAISVLKRRRAAALATGGVQSVTVPGAISVTLGKTELTALDARIAALEAQWADESGTDPDGVGVSWSRLCRVTPR
jgi:hypothetical protein